MKIKGFEKGKNQIPIGKKWQLLAELKKALNVHSDRGVYMYSSGNIILKDPSKIQAIDSVFRSFGITEWADEVTNDDNNDNNIQ